MTVASDPLATAVSNPVLNGVDLPPGSFPPALLTPAWFTPDWKLPTGVTALVTTRCGGVSTGAYDSFNLGTHVGDDPASVATNRAHLRTALPAEPIWLEQVHGTTVVEVVSPALYPHDPHDPHNSNARRADGIVTREIGVVCVIQTADCMPVLFAADDGSVVAAAHAGWRGLVNGILEETVARMAIPAQKISAYLGPAIARYEVGAEVRAAFVAHDAAAAHGFTDKGAGKYWCDLVQLARQRLDRAGVLRVAGGNACTFDERDRFFSYRRDSQTGRMASLIWRA